MSTSDASEINDRLSSLDLKKGEFETIDAFNVRVDEVSSSITAPIIIQSGFNAEVAQYDADCGVLRFLVFAWDNAATGWDQVFGLGHSPAGITYSSCSGDGYLGLGLGQTEDVTDAYNGSNA